MKKKFLALSLLATVTIFAASANPGSGDEPRAKQIFAQQFSGAENVQWTDSDGQYSKVSFTWGGHRAEAYFNEKGDFLGAVRGMFYSQLPLAVIRSLESSYKGNVVLEAREISNEDGTSYSLLIEKKEKRYRLRMSSNGSIDESKRIK